MLTHLTADLEYSVPLNLTCQREVSRQRDKLETDETWKKMSINGCLYHSFLAALYLEF